jgi:hypothetical protein
MIRAASFLFCAIVGLASALIWSFPTNLAVAFGLMALFVILKAWWAVAFLEQTRAQALAELIEALQEIGKCAGLLFAWHIWDFPTGLAVMFGLVALFIISRAQAFAELIEALQVIVACAGCYIWSAWGFPTGLAVVFGLLALFVVLRDGGIASLEWLEKQKRKRARARALAELDQAA